MLPFYGETEVGMVVISVMVDHEQANRKSKRLKTAIIILSILLLLSIGGLAAWYAYLAYFTPVQVTVVLPDNLIGKNSSLLEESADSEGGHLQTSVPANNENNTVGSSSPAKSASVGTANTESDRTAHRAAAKMLELYQGKPSDNQKFDVQNMFPGDQETRYFCIKTYHNADITLFFRADVTEETKNLSNVLHIKVTHMESNEVLCDAPFSQIDGQEFSRLLSANAENETISYYQIDVSLDTSVGNEYQAALLKADFEWYVEDEGELTPPKTGDRTNILLWIVLAASLLLLILLLTVKRRKENEQHEQA